MVASELAPHQTHSEEEGLQSNSPLGVGAHTGPRLEDVLVKAAAKLGTQSAYCLADLSGAPCEQNNVGVWQVLHLAQHSQGWARGDLEEKQQAREGKHVQLVVLLCRMSVG